MPRRATLPFRLDRRPGYRIVRRDWRGRSNSAEAKNADIIAHDHHLSSMGVFSARYALILLSDAGYVDTVYKVATQTTEPSWGFWIANDIHTMLEGWALSSRSFDHHYWGLISNWFYQSLAGIRPGAPGYDRIVIRPEIPRDLERVSAHLDTVRGRVASAWTQADWRAQLDVVIPAGAQAEVWTENPADAVPTGARLIRQDGARTIYAVGAGAHRFAWRRP